MIANAYLGQIAAVAFDFAPHQWAWCNGDQLPVDRNKPLFGLLGSKYSDAAKTKFALPKMPDPSKGIRYVICVQGPYPPATQREVFEPTYIGMLCEWQYPRIPEECTPADGRTLSIFEEEALFKAIGTKFGGDGQQTFQLPNLGGKWIIALKGVYPTK